MNMDNNRRFQETETEILGAYGRLANTKKLNRITVADICREAGIHRTTFYGHFQDVADLETKIVKKQFANFYRAFCNENGKWSYHDGTLNLVQFFYDNRATIQRHLTEVNDGNSAEQFMDRAVILEHMDVYKRTFHCNTEQEVWYHQEFLCNGMLAILRAWIMSGCRESPEEITSMLTRFFGIGTECD